ncbi:MAG: hypothetical protein KUA35_10880 [Pseudodesulfovibrio sp.]|nr:MULTISPECIES: hypothetical protein [Pseudodesulfovibrio]MBU4190954.1 hypothetical protein [Pseudomonadota bacterium]MBU4242725.1 hypothetical protein [Pseudomonadota bacterium]MBU4377818.1 hypothetical protein [Pseudomonadota bacterium]MBU4473874.1 hypothetical protein [Pseudomonadota bacterium]MBU4516583.1 hypothetical protein [Pseudomonadota bacterium]
MDTREHAMGALPYLVISIVTFLVMQSLVVVTHEFTHSTMAWVLGEMPSPLGIVWGNPLTMTGWDEGVDYERLFAQGRTLHAALIGFCPLIMHSLVVGIGIGLMRGRWLARRRWVFHVVYWLVVANVMELVAYVWMRAFSGHGDVGIFDRATGISPWWVFILGSALLAWALWLFFRRAMPRLQRLFAPENQPTRWAILILTAFLIFLWGSGIRVMLYVSGPQWLFGLIGVAAFAAAVTVFRPACNR